MPIASFFATQADLTPGLETLQKKRPLQFVRCTAGGWLDSPLIPTYNSLLDATDLDHLQFRTLPGRDIDRLHLIEFYMLDVNVSITVEEHLIGAALPGGGTIRYKVALPKTYIGKSCAYQTSFRQSDLFRSRFAANQFAYCDFTEADLSGSFLANFFMGCKFEKAILTKADMRWSTFENCTFAGAKMNGAKLLKKHVQEILLSDEQKAEIAWQKNSGPEPLEF